MGGAECENEECGKRGVWKTRSVENAECGKCGVWKMRSAENAECGKCGVWKTRSVESLVQLYFKYRMDKIF